jgi:hypothetical protein
MLRRVDWRFLLPVSRAPRVASFTDGPLGRALDLVGEERVDARRCAGSADLAVVVDPSPGTLRAAAGCLRAGGALYGEWYSPRAGGAPGVRRELERAGFTDVECYWPWPSPRRRSPQVWLPLEAPEAISFFLATRPPRSTGPGRWGQAVLALVWRLLRQLRLLVPTCAVASIGGRGPSERGLLERVLDRWGEWSVEPAPAGLSWLLLAPGRRSVNKVVGFIFAAGRGQPVAVAKIARAPEGDEALTKEAENLRAFDSGAVPRGVPRLLLLDRVDGRVALAETALAGRQCSTMLVAGAHRQLAHRVTEWLVGLARFRGSAVAGSAHDRLIEPALVDFESSFGAVVDPAELRSARALLSSLPSLPPTYEHRDCSPWNALVADDGSISLADWESAEPHGLPVLDLAYFLTYAAFFVDGALDSGKLVDSFRATFVPSTPTGSVTLECQRRYMRALGLDARVLPALRLLTWMIHSRSELRLMSADAAGQPHTSALAQSLYVGLWREELRQAPVQGAGRHS